LCGSYWPQCNTAIVGTLAQVAGRADSPAHRAEIVQIASQVLNQGNLSLPPSLTHLHVAALLQEGVALDLPDGSQLTVGALRPESPWVGKQIQYRTLTGPITNSRIVAVLRGKSVIIARPQTVLQPGDRILIVASPQAQTELIKHLVMSPTSNPQPATPDTSKPPELKR
jgi:chloride channel protein, CIC family